MASTLISESYPCCMDCGKTPKDNRLIQAYLKSWKDVYDSNGTIKLSLPSLKLCSECLVGHFIPVLRQSTATWEFGSVHCYDECTEKHQFVFMDEDKEWIRVVGDTFVAYAREFNRNLKPRSRRRQHHGTASIVTKKKEKKLPPPDLSPSTMLNATALDEDDLTVAIGHLKDDENQVCIMSKRTKEQIDKPLIYKIICSPINLSSFLSIILQNITH